VNSQFPTIFSVDSKEASAWRTLSTNRGARMSIVDFRLQISEKGETPLANRAKAALGAHPGAKVENRFPKIVVRERGTHVMHNNDQDHTISKYDRLYSSLHDVSKLFTKPSTVKTVQSLTGHSETFVIETVRHEERGDFIFVECVDENAVVTRLALPPKVANAIASQRDSLTRRRRSIASRALAKQRMDRGELPGFMRKKKAS
jgi:hypothetical protein